LATFCIYLFNDIKKNVLARGTPGYCKWHPGWEPLVYTLVHCESSQNGHQNRISSLWVVFAGLTFISGVDKRKFT